MGRWPGAGISSEELPGGRGQSAECCVGGIRCLEQIRRHLFLMPAVLPPKATPIPSDHDLFMQRLLGTVHHVQPVVQERSRLTDIEILLPVGSVTEADVQPPAHHQESTTGFLVWRVGPCDCMVTCSG